MNIDKMIIQSVNNINLETDKEKTINNIKAKTIKKLPKNKKIIFSISSLAIASIVCAFIIPYLIKTNVNEIIKSSYSNNSSSPMSILEGAFSTSLKSTTKYENNKEIEVNYKSYLSIENDNIKFENDQLVNFSLIRNVHTDNDLKTKIVYSFDNNISYFFNNNFNYIYKDIVTLSNISSKKGFINYSIVIKPKKEDKLASIYVYNDNNEIIDSYENKNDISSHSFLEGYFSYTIYMGLIGLEKYDPYKNSNL